ncbi:MAG TPA: response regulator [Candidatus Blautia stercorigallinarum]|uniref:Stage 0 sporulation protein A homolog n=1 Tax=Candidatus Blautia stercorigallinarum TaxID=2838501 RepID=A0A9D1PEJ3_9FIRM|nr:response regulator [Candidatus Blautia stercorigallinarum]
MEKKDILIVDDMEINRAILSQIFADRNQILEGENGLEAVQILEERREHIAAVLLDILMPVMDGFQVMEKMKDMGLMEKIPVFLITADSSEESMRRGYQLGAMDIIEKPIVPYFVRRRVESVMELFAARERLSHVVELQGQKLRRQEQEILNLNYSIIESLSTAIEFRSGESGEHVKRIRRLTRLLLEELGRTGKKEYVFSDREIQEISQASIMHDVGKIAISDLILNKPGRLTDEEFEIMKSHTVMGCQVLEQIPQYKNNRLYQYAYDICRHHHERWDGKGYPDGLKGREITVWSQVVSVADVFDALTNKRVYKPAIPVPEAMDMIFSGQCGAFNPELLEALEKILPQIEGKM